MIMAFLSGAVHSINSDRRFLFIVLKLIIIVIIWWVFFPFSWTQIGLSLVVIYVWSWLLRERSVCYWFHFFLWWFFAACHHIINWFYVLRPISFEIYAKLKRNRKNQCEIKMIADCKKNHRINGTNKEIRI